MARFRFTVNEKRSTGASGTQQQEQEQQQQAHSGSDNNTCLRRPMLPPVLALPAFEDSNSEDNREELLEVMYSSLLLYCMDVLHFLNGFFWIN
ncbi:hypothetical protein NC653_014096 [Populus alba x Populus x berolinensis]|uniref:Uncharacterized protein n=1 Tax=Populus alba x Populus x berolinensis TaxID=444605 RepID=A0AAD6W3V7_9ROSI|nr:hypothetical protein NC653_014096 [Populus alba x Populus x berolinensis]